METGSTGSIITIIMEAPHLLVVDLLRVITPVMFITTLAMLIAMAMAIAFSMLVKMEMTTTVTVMIVVILAILVMDVAIMAMEFPELCHFGAPVVAMMITWFALFVTR